MNKQNDFAIALKKIEQTNFEYMEDRFKCLGEGLIKFKEMREYEYEYLAFAHYEGAGQSAEWKTYHGPFCISRTKEGTIEITFNQDKITKETVEYWKKRAFESKNPMFYSHYADLIIDYHYADIHKTDHIHKYVNRYAQGIIEIIEKIIDNTFQQSLSLSIFSAIKRCSRLLIQLNNDELLNHLTKKCFELEQLVGKDEHPGLWGYAANLYLLSPPKIHSGLVKDIVVDLQTRFNRIKQNTEKNPLSSLESVCFLLIKIYHSQNLNDDKRQEEIFEEYSKGISPSADNSGGFLKLHYAQNKIEFLERLALKEGWVNKKRKAINLERNTTNLDQNRLQEHCIKVSVSGKLLDPLKQISEEVRGSENIEEVVKKHIRYFFLSQEKMKKEYQDTERFYPLACSVNTILISSNNTILSKVTKQEDKMLQHGRVGVELGICTAKDFFLKPLLERFNAQEIASYIMSGGSPNDVMKIPTLETALNYLNKKEYLAFSHIAAPMCEDVLKNFAKDIGLDIYRPHIYEARPESLHKVLITLEEQIEQKKEIFFFYRFCLTERYGHGLRNIIAHGTSQSDFQDPLPAFMLFYILLSTRVCLGDREKIAKQIQENKELSKEKNNK